VVSFHGLLGKPGNTDGRRITAKVLVLHGNDDPMVPVADVVALEEELSAAGADWQIHTYGNTLHSFTNPEANDPGFGVKYDANADRRSRQTMLNFLEEVLA
jgi:dienelactone hydrolase